MADSTFSVAYNGFSDSDNMLSVTDNGFRNVKNVGTGRLQLVAGAAHNCRLSEAQSQVAGGEWVSAGMFQNSREIIVAGLTPGTMYTFQLLSRRSSFHAGGPGHAPGYPSWVTVKPGMIDRELPGKRRRAAC